jgi:hypothetical protein
MEWDRLTTPLRLAKALWSSEAWELSSTRFKELFDKTYRKSDKLKTLWQLGGAINDYLGAHPGAFSVPPELPWRLLRSDDREARVIGLKLLKRLTVPNSQRVEEYFRAIERRDGYESCGGLYELGQFLEHCQSSRERIAMALADRVLRVLEDHKDDDDDNHRRWVERLQDLVKTVRE